MQGGEEYKMKAVDKAWMLVNISRRGTITIELSSPHKTDLEPWATKTTERIVEWYITADKAEYLVIDGKHVRIA